MTDSLDQERTDRYVVDAVVTQVTRVDALSRVVAGELRRLGSVFAQASGQDDRSPGCVVALELPAGGEIAVPCPRRPQQWRDTSAAAS